MLKSILFVGIIIAIFLENCSAADTLPQDDEKSRKILTHSGFSGVEIEKLMPIFDKYPKDRMLYVSYGFRKRNFHKRINFNQIFCLIALFMSSFGCEGSNN